MVAAAEKHRFAVGGGVEIHGEEWRPEAGGHPVGFVLVHGLASNTAMWNGVADRLWALGHHVFAVDQRGHGRSTKPQGPYDMDSFVADLARVVEQLPFRRPALAGQSFGGNVVLELAERRPDLVGGVACVDGGWIELSERFSSWDHCRSVMAPPELEGKPAHELEAMIRDRRHDWPEQGIRGFMANFEIRDDGTVRPWLSRPHHLEILHSLWEHRPSELYASVGIPVLLVPAVAAGRSDGPGEAVDRAAALLPSARVEPMTGDHDLHAQHPVEVADLLHEWVDSSL